MTRKVLCVGLTVLCFCIGVVTAVIQSHNRDRGVALDVLKERCSMLEAINSDRAAQILACDYGPLPIDIPSTAERKSAAQHNLPSSVTP